MDYPGTDRRKTSARNVEVQTPRNVSGGDSEKQTGMSQEDINALLSGM